MRRINFLVLLLCVTFPCLAADTSLVTKAKRAVGELLFDADSAKFKIDHQGNGLACGKVNGKNRMGGYVGSHLFAYQAPTTTAPEAVYIDGVNVGIDALPAALACASILEKPKPK